MKPRISPKFNSSPGDGELAGAPPRLGFSFAGIGNPPRPPRHVRPEPYDQLPHLLCRLRCRRDGRWRVYPGRASCGSLRGDFAGCCSITRAVAKRYSPTVSLICMGGTLSWALAGSRFPRLRSFLSRLPHRCDRRNGAIKTYRTGGFDGFPGYFFSSCTVCGRSVSPATLRDRRNRRHQNLQNRVLMVL